MRVLAALLGEPRRDLFPLRHIGVYVGPDFAKLGFVHYEQCRAVEAGLQVIIRCDPDEGKAMVFLVAAGDGLVFVYGVRSIWPGQ